MSTAISAGTVLGGRYRLEDLLDDVSGARSWRATDTVLVRDVRVYVLADGDPRVEPMLEAARVSARVTDPHLLRVLDADVRDGLAWVVSEWGEGRTLDQMVGRGVLPADRSAWLVREVAAAVAAAGQHDLAHGRLAPENVMVTASGTVRLVGFAIDATLQQSRRRSGHYPDVSDREADLLDLAGLLYAALVGRWAGASGSVVEPAPRDARGPLRPRQVRAGVPRPLDALCDRVLTRRSSDLDARQLASVLTEYLGELAAADPTLLPVPGPEVPASPVPVPSSDDDAAAPSDDDDDAADLGAAAPGPQTAGPPADPPADPSADPVRPGSPAAPDVDPAGGSHRADVEAPDPVPDAVTDPAPASSSLPPDDETSLIGEQTQSGRHRPSGPDDDPDWYKPRPGPRPPVPDLEPPPERPLFAPDDARVRSQAGRASVTTSWGATDWADQHPRQSWASGDRRDEEPRWPVGHDPREPAQEWDEPARHWLRLPLLIGLLALVAIVVAFLLAFQGSGSQPSGAPPASHTAAARVSPTGPGSA